MDSVTALKTHLYECQAAFVVATDLGLKLLVAWLFSTQAFPFEEECPKNTTHFTPSL